MTLLKDQKLEFLKISEKNVDQVVKIHISAFPGFFLTELGRNSLRVFYRSLVFDNSTIFYGIKKEEEIVGFFVASISPKGLYKKIFFKNFFSFLIPLALSLLQNIRLIKKMIISYTSYNTFKAPSNKIPSLLSICINPDTKNQGLGKLLIDKLENELMVLNQPGYYLTTDKENNDAVNQFYLNNGFQLHGDFIQGKRKMNIYVKTFSQ